MKEDTHSVKTIHFPVLNCLTHLQVELIDEALAEVRDFGEVRLVVNKGRLRYLVLQKSYDALHESPKEIMKEF